MNSTNQIPTQEEISKIESKMPEELRRVPKNQAGYYEEEMPPWESFDEKIDENFFRKKPSPDVVKRMNKSIEELGQLFEGSDLNWHLDGALNISLMNGAGKNPDKYIGEHKDVDISVEKGELEAMEAQLLKKGYGFFVSRIENKTGKMIMRRVRHRDFDDSSIEHLLIVAIDENGKLRRDTSLNFVDIHIIQRNEEGNPLGILGTPMPGKWVQPQPIEFHGKQINLSHPGKVLYYKLHQGRNYDFTDTQQLIEMGEVTEEDIDDIERVYEDEFKTTIEHGRNIFEIIADQISPEMNADTIFDIIQSHPELKKRGNMNEGLKKLAEKIAEAENKSVDNILAIAMNLFGVEKNQNQKRQELKLLRQKVKDIKEMEQIRKEH
ncbi:hypothetical protein KKC32_02155 [Patescibacteria group bacterium]|nr:hypothetical protein [Patescibacteria group bacterium]